MESQGLCVVERPMAVDLIFSSTAATVFWDQVQLDSLQQKDGNASRNIIMEMVSMLSGSPHVLRIYCSNAKNLRMQVTALLPGISQCFKHCTIVAISASDVLCKVMACANQIAQAGKAAGVTLEVLPLTNMELFLPMLDEV